jgi:gluconolactonase
VTGAVTVYRSPSGFANGNTRDRQGRLITCEHGGRRVIRTELDGTVPVLIDRFEGKRLNGPNDVVVHADGQIWFTDPGYGLLSKYEGARAPLELPTRVYRLDPDSGAARVVIDTLTRPNGICFSRISRGCMWSTPGAPTIRAIIAASWSTTSPTGPPRTSGLCDMAPGRGDGIRCDVDGNLWAASCFGGPDSNGVQVFAPDGTKIGMIHLPEPCSNLCFGGLKRNRLFMTGGQSLYSLYVEAQGVPYA